MLTWRRTLCALGLVALAGCQIGDASRQDDGAPDESLRAGVWGDYSMTRPERSAREVVARARAIGEVVLDNPDLPSTDLLDPVEMDAWAEAARKDRYREGALRFDLAGHDILVRYRPASDRLTVTTFDQTPGPVGTWASPGANLSQADAEQRARTCLAKLEDAGVIGEGEFDDGHRYVSSKPTLVEGSGATTLGRYSFVYHPVLNGLPLLSAEVVISVNANSGRCQRITVGGQVTLNRLRDTEVAFRDEELAQRLVADAVVSASPGSPSQVHVYGEFGYYLPLTASTRIVRPTYVANYTIETGTPEQPILGRRRLVSLPVDDESNPELIELLGPNW